ncbi:LacI family DNA-binding transcriptional regulator [Pseudobacillus wudalianchiensis]|uniref:DNA-binding protein n=1 Tax=Pseudobacillus wudalianchiensis TaxID=1743143 RepID=A0A1B9AGA8_9BACI|nr:LacI family DNA-binding transcriptional regulator [Bacillus wudalianchiensis]OCA82881.1 DNA-binding protein [Bacillus wudalianchiensis]
MLTIKEIAEMAKVSRSTVSRVLNDSGYVSEEARRRVLAVIEETGYMPSQHAKALRTKKTKVIGVILPKISTETSGRVVNGINEVLQDQGYQILLTATNLDYQKEIEYLRLLKSRQVDGIILIATTVNAELVAEIHQLNKPFVAIGQDIPKASSVTFDDYHAAKEMTNYLIRKGYKNIAFIGVDESDPAVGIHRKQGFMSAMQDAKLTIHKEWMGQANFTIPSGFEAMKRIIRNSPENLRPDAVFAVTDRIAVGAMQYLKKAGFTVPQEMAVAGIGAADISKYIDPALTTIDFENERAGREAAVILLEKIESHKEQQKKVVLNYRVIEGDSV